MRIAGFILLLLIGANCFAQDAEMLKKSVTDFNTALMKKDTVILKKLLHEKLSYGHSNGWIETKKLLIEDLFNGKLVYTAIGQEVPEITMEGNAASIRTQANIDVIMDGKPLQFKLKILQVWVWKKKAWQMLSRQSVKM